VKFSKIKFHENPSSESPIVPLGQEDGRTDTTKVTAAFRNKNGNNTGQTEKADNITAALLRRPIVITSLGQSQTVGQ
jgi:hypothetical protein